MGARSRIGDLLKGIKTAQKGRALPIGRKFMDRRLHLPNRGDVALKLPHLSTWSFGLSLGEEVSAQDSLNILPSRRARIAIRPKRPLST